VIARIPRKMPPNLTIAFMITPPSVGHRFLIEICRSWMGNTREWRKI
jgi:hypothetical protein